MKQPIAHKEADNKDVYQPSRKYEIIESVQFYIHNSSSGSGAKRTAVPLVAGYSTPFSVWLSHRFSSLD